ncbi:3-oxo-tetronate kinase [Dickeya zeae]|uniref:3-oxo-tetronate kinase n=1 Tax=Dickeya zeae TaxID=204042 RepID=UPI00037004A8|nr:3-oxo-tetronate kinase [Dickeya zeae]UJR56237.1 four-carbon acid sugar kinase family protein [Dickeya zeae MS1]UJR63875.1 four-carbon acid sugar kinase family protein [Dickeya zeae]
MITLGVIADDFTGATDIASFLVQNGLSTVQLNGVPSADYQVQAQAVVISLKSRSCPVQQAIDDSLNALSWLQAQHCQQFYFKYCSTFDSTANGNIGPVTDALLDALGESMTVISPALPVNGRTVYQGHLFVMDQLLSDSGMRHHPVTPMTDSSLLRLMERQARGRCGLVPYRVMEQGSTAVQQQLAQLREQGCRYAVLDTLNEQHLLTQGEALRTMKLVTGGSGLAIGLARVWAGADSRPATKAGEPQPGPAVVLSGSCSVMTNQQVACYRQQAASQAVDVARCLASEAGLQRYARELADWAIAHRDDALAPLLFATAEPQALSAIQHQYGAAASSRAVETLFASVAAHLQAAGFRRFIIAGGETSSIVVQTLGIRAFHIGPTISPGVPWVTSVDHPLSLALKSGNFGDENFFARAQHPSSPSTRY